MKKLTELRDKMRAKNYLENAKILDAAIERIGELEKDSSFYRCCALSGEIPDDSKRPSLIGGENE